MRRACFQSSAHVRAWPAPACAMPLPPCRYSHPHHCQPASPLSCFAFFFSRLTQPLSLSLSSLHPPLLRTFPHPSKAPDLRSVLKPATSQLPPTCRSGCCNPQPLIACASPCDSPPPPGFPPSARAHAQYLALAPHWHPFPNQRLGLFGCLHALPWYDSKLTASGHVLPRRLPSLDCGQFQLLHCCVRREERLVCFPLLLTPILPL